jgi:hypothetical protein
MERVRGRLQTSGLSGNRGWSNGPSDVPSGHFRCLRRRWNLGKMSELCRVRYAVRYAWRCRRGLERPNTCGQASGIHHRG